MTASQRLFEIANALAGEDISKNYEPTFTGAFDALTDTLAGYNVERGKTISEAIKAAAPYISGGSSPDLVSVVLQPQKFSPSSGGWQETYYIQETHDRREGDYTFYPLYDRTEKKIITDFTVDEESGYDTYHFNIPAGHIVELGNMCPEEIDDCWQVDSDSICMSVVNGMPVTIPLSDNNFSADRRYNSCATIPCDVSACVIYARYVITPHN